MTNATTDAAFERFVHDVGPRIERALIAAYGLEIGSEAFAEAIAVGWERWGELSAMDNPAGYLFRVGQSRARPHVRWISRRRRFPVFTGGLAAQHGKDFETPALLLVWENEQGDLVPITVETPLEPIETPPDANPIDSEQVTGWIWHTDGITSAYLEPAGGSGMQLYAADESLPDDVIVAIATALDPDGTMSWIDDPPSDVDEVGRQETDAMTHAATYERDGDTVVVATHNDYPFNGLTLTPGTTIIPDLTALGANGFALAGTSPDGAPEITVYVTSDGGPIISIRWTGAVDDVAAVLELAESVRPASPEQQAEFDSVG